jgi:hypothetical protein
VPQGLTAGAALAAAATSIGGEAELIAAGGFIQRPILWVPLIAPPGSGKTPAEQAAYDAIDEWQRDQEPEESTNPKTNKTEVRLPPSVTLTDYTIEALVRELNRNESIGVEVDELSTVLRGVGEYKGGSSGDRGRLLKLWTGRRWNYTRVGSAGKVGNAVQIVIENPTVTICGGLQTELHHLLGEEGDGMRHRWLPHLEPRPGHMHAGVGDSSAWRTVIRTLLDNRAVPRQWTLSPGAKALWDEQRRVWKSEANAIGNSACLTGAMDKADIHVLRVVLVLVELVEPVVSGSLRVSAETMHRAIKLVAYTLDCWRALPETGGLALRPLDEKLDIAVDKIAAWLDDHGPTANRGELSKAKVGGRTAEDLNDVLYRYEQRYPGVPGLQLGRDRGALRQAHRCSLQRNASSCSAAVSSMIVERRTLPPRALRLCAGPARFPRWRRSRRLACSASRC